MAAFHPFQAGQPLSLEFSIRAMTTGSGTTYARIELISPIAGQGPFRCHFFEFDYGCFHYNDNAVYLRTMQGYPYPGISFGPAVQVPSGRFEWQRIRIDFFWNTRTFNFTANGAESGPFKFPWQGDAESNGWTPFTALSEIRLSSENIGITADFDAIALDGQAVLESTAATIESTAAPTSTSPPATPWASSPNCAAYEQFESGAAAGWSLTPSAQIQETVTGMAGTYSLYLGTSPGDSIREIPTTLPRPAYIMFRLRSEGRNDGSDFARIRFWERDPRVAHTGSQVGYFGFSMFEHDLYVTAPPDNDINKPTGIQDGRDMPVGAGVVHTVYFNWAAKTFTWSSFHGERTFSFPWGHDGDAYSVKPTSIGFVTLQNNGGPDTWVDDICFGANVPEPTTPEPTLAPSTIVAPTTTAAPTTTVAPTTTAAVPATTVPATTVPSAPEPGCAIFEDFDDDYKIQTTWTMNGVIDFTTIGTAGDFALLVKDSADAWGSWSFDAVHRPTHISFDMYVGSPTAGAPVPFGYFRLWESSARDASGKGYFGFQNMDEYVDIVQSNPDKASGPGAVRYVQKANSWIHHSVELDWELYEMAWTIDDHSNPPLVTSVSMPHRTGWDTLSLPESIGFIEFNNYRSGGSPLVAYNNLCIGYAGTVGASSAVSSTAPAATDSPLASTSTLMSTAFPVSTSDTAAGCPAVGDEAGALWLKGGQAAVFFGDNADATLCRSGPSTLSTEAEITVKGIDVASTLERILAKLDGIETRLAALEP